MLLQCREIIKRIDTGQVAGMDQAHEQISNSRTIFSFIKQCIFPMQDGFFESSFADIVVCAVIRRTLFPGEIPGRQTVAPAGSTGGGSGGNK